MHSHNVYFWLKEGLTGSEIKEFEQGLQSLVEFPLVNRGLYGKPADTHRSVVERSYSYGLLLSFKSLADHDAYQASPTHLTFVEKNGPKWVKAQVFDVET